MRRTINATIAIIMAAIAILTINPTSASAAGAKCGTYVEIVDYTVREYGAAKMTGIPAVITYDDCSVANIVIMGRGLGGNIYPTYGGSARVEYGLDAIVGISKVYIKGQQGSWSFFGR